MRDPTEPAEESARRPESGAREARVAALFEHATLVAELRAAVERRPRRRVDPDEPPPWKELIEAAVSQPDSIDQELVASIAERLGRKDPTAVGEPATRGKAPGSEEVRHRSRLSEMLTRLIVVTGLAKLRGLWRRA